MIAMLEEGDGEGQLATYYIPQLLSPNPPHALPLLRESIYTTPTCLDLVPPFPSFLFASLPHMLPA